MGGREQALGRKQMRPTWERKENPEEQGREGDEVRKKEGRRW